MFRHLCALAALAALSFTSVACANPTDDDAEAEETSQDLVSRSAYFETFEGLDDQHYFHFVAANGANVLRSQPYATKGAAEEGRKAFLAIGSDARQYDKLALETGEHYFVVKATNGRVLGSSNLFTTSSSAERGARAVRFLVREAREQEQQVVAAPRREAFELFEGEDGQVYFRLRAANGEIVLASEGYADRGNAREGVASVNTNGKDASRFELVKAADEGYAIRLRAENGQIVARGETYASKSNAERAVKRLTAMLANTIAIAQ